MATINDPTNSQFTAVNGTDELLSRSNEFNAGLMSLQALGSQTSGSNSSDAQYSEPQTPRSDIERYIKSRSTSISNKEEIRSLFEPRVVCVGVCWRRCGGETQILVITSRHRKHSGRWVLPKGGWEPGETHAEAALRESWEEAGINGVITSKSPFLLMDDSRPIKDLQQGDKFICRSRYICYDIHVNALCEDWPEASERDREWVSYDTALSRVSWRPELKAIMEACPFSPDGGKRPIRPKAPEFVL